MYAAWSAAGSLGVLGQPLRLALTWLLLSVSVVVLWPTQRRRWGLLIAAGAMLALCLFFPANGLCDVLLVVAVLAALAAGQRGATQRVLLLCAFAALVLAIWQWATAFLPAAWLLADVTGAWLGHCAGGLTGRALEIGASFAGLDYLVLTVAFVGGWLWLVPGARWLRVGLMLASVVAVHLLYLAVLSVASDLLAMLPIPPPPEFPHPYVPPPWNWARAAAQLLPWNLPALAAVLYLPVLVALLRWTAWPADSAEAERPPIDWRPKASEGRFNPRTVPVLALVIALLVPFAGVLSLGPSQLHGKRFLANATGHMDWSEPQFDAYGRRSAGRYGMLPRFVESLGGQLAITTDFSAAELADTDVVLLLRPAGAMPAEQLDRIWEFVRGGGSLLVVAGPQLREGGLENSSNDVLQPTAMLVRRDVAISSTGSWQQVGRYLSHPATCGLASRSQQLGFTDSGASLALGWPARPLLVGRWGWSDPGCDALLTNVFRWEAGERLGDVVLAAEQPWGRGTVIVLGDEACLTNEGNVRGFEWTGRLLSYLAHRWANPQALWRQCVTFLLLALLLGLVSWQPRPLTLLAVAWTLSGSLALCDTASRSASRVVPDGRLLVGGDGAARAGLAYIDGSHLEAYSDTDWGFDATNGLALTLMRNGYLTLRMPEVSRERLERAAVVVSIAPARGFTPAERQELKTFVERGGLLISTVGAEEAGPSAPLLADFGLRVPLSPVPTRGQGREPQPMGRFRSLYLNAKDYGRGDYKVGVVFHVGWPVEAEGKDSEVLVHGERDEPIVIARKVGDGRIVLIGDTGFAMNKNLEYIGGEPFEGRYENAHFWRWLLSRMTGQPEWVPPEPPPLVQTEDMVEEAKP